MKPLDVGQEVVWFSKMVQRRGTVLSAVAPGVHPRDVFHKLHEENKALRFSYQGVGKPLGATSYLVAANGGPNVKTWKVFWLKRIHLEAV